MLLHALYLRSQDYEAKTQCEEVGGHLVGWVYSHITTGAPSFRNSGRWLQFVVAPKSTTGGGLDALVALYFDHYFVRLRVADHVSDEDYLELVTQLVSLKGTSDQPHCNPQTIMLRYMCRREHVLERVKEWAEAVPHG